jgi:hypothetical protein
MENFMKNKLIYLLVFGSILAMSILFAWAPEAQAHEEWHHGGGHYVYRPGIGWVVPAVVGGMIVYEATRPTISVDPGGVVARPTIIVPPTPAPVGYHWEALLESNCSCYKTVLIPN